MNSEKQPLKPHQRLQKEAEPWALDQEADSVQEAFTESAGGVGLLTKAPGKKPDSFEMAMEALSRVKGQTVQQSIEPIVQQKMESVFELAVSPGVANKQFTPKQMMTLAEVVGEKGTMEYTPNHKIVLKIPTTNPEVITGKLQSANFLLSPIGDVLTLKACDFCDGEKTESIPYADEIHRVLGGMKMPKELNIGFNGCGMACYSAVMDDIGIVFRKGKFDLFLGAKPVGRTAHPGQPVAEGIEPEQLVELITDIVAEYKQNAHPNERLLNTSNVQKRYRIFLIGTSLPK